MDSLNKRINFLNDVIKKLDLNGIETVHARMEEYSKNNIEKFDLKSFSERGIVYLVFFARRKRNLYLCYVAYEKTSWMCIIFDAIFYISYQFTIKNAISTGFILTKQNSNRRQHIR